MQYLVTLLSFHLNKMLAGTGSANHHVIRNILTHLQNPVISHSYHMCITFMSRGGLWWSYSRDGCQDGDCSWELFQHLSVSNHWVFLTRDHGISTFWSVTALDTFENTLGHFPAMCVVTKPGILLMSPRNISCLVHGNSNWYYTKNWKLNLEKQPCSHVFYLFCHARLLSLILRGNDKRKTDDRDVCPLEQVGFRNISFTGLIIDNVLVNWGCSHPGI